MGEAPLRRRDQHSDCAPYCQVRYLRQVAHGSDEDARLEALGIRVMQEARPDVRDECIRVARRLRHAGKKIIGLLPSSNDIGVSAIAVQLGLALAEVSGGTVAFVDANLRWPAISDLAAGAAGAGDESVFATRWLRGSLALITPRRAVAAGAGVTQLARVIQHGAELFAQVLVDLTGFQRLGEHLAAIEMVDGVLVVGRAGRTREDELLELRLELAKDRQLGVLLVG